MMTDEWIEVLVACAEKVEKFDQQDVVVVVVADHSHSTITMKPEPRQTKNNETKSPYYSVAQSLLFCGWLAATVVVGRTVTATAVCGGGGADSTLICHCVRVQQQQVSPFVAFSHFAPHSGRSSVRPFAFACATTDPLLSDQLTFSDSSRAHGSGAAALLATQKKVTFSTTPGILVYPAICRNVHTVDSTSVAERKKRDNAIDEHTKMGSKFFHDCQE